MHEGKRRPSDAARALAATIQRQALSPPPVRQAAPPEPPPQKNAPATSFAALPGLRMLAMQGEALAGHGLSPPFFRAQSTGGAGMTAMIDEAPKLSFASYDYLGLNRHPAVRDAATKAIAAEGLSAGASRLVGGERPVHRVLEQALAAHYGTEDALCLVSGHATNVTLLGTLLGNEDMVILDAYAHNSLHEGARLSGAARRVFAHNDLDALSRLLAAERRRHRHVLIAVEGLYSMDGDTPDLARLVELKDRYDAWLLVDEAHALGVTGPGGAGTASAQGVEPTAVEIWMGTLSKTLAATGGYVAGSSSLIDYLRHTAPGFIFSVGLPPPLAAGAAAALSILQAEPDRHDALAANGALFRDAALCAGLDTGLSEGHAITPILLGSSLHAVALAERLFDAGIYAGPIVHPAVPENQARLRFFLTALHQPAEIEAAVETIARLRHDLDAWIERRADDARQSTRAPSDGGRPRAHGSGAR